jgi:hypothetical protein
MERTTYRFRYPVSSGAQIVRELIKVVPQAWLECGWVSGYLRHKEDSDAILSLGDLIEWGGSLKELTLLVHHKEPCYLDSGVMLTKALFDNDTQFIIAGKRPRAVHFGNAGYQNSPFSIRMILNQIVEMMDEGYVGAFGLSTRGTPYNRNSNLELTQAASLSVFSGLWLEWNVPESARLPMPPSICAIFYPKYGGYIEDIEPFLSVCDSTGIEALGVKEFNAVRI